MTITTFLELDKYCSQIEIEIQKTIPQIGPKSIIRDACEYALLSGGKRLRPAISMMVAESLGKNNVMQAALATEFFHTASLIADDLPCMDDDDFRRNKPSVHKTFGEGVALLTSYALIASGYECIANNAKMLKTQNRGDICLLALENATYNTGLNGATGGQFLDVFPPDLNLPMLLEIMHKKTVSLFEIAFVLGWLFGEGDIQKLDLVKQAASHFGIAFQIADDIEDAEKDALSGRKVNIVSVCGLEAAHSMLENERNKFEEVMKNLGLNFSI